MLPDDFLDDVARARDARQAGDLRLLSDEVRAFDWAGDGLHVVGEAQLEIGALAGARETFEALRRIDPGDVRASERLGALAREAAAPGPGSGTVVLFTGHMVDAPDRPKNKARFPPTAEAEATARRMIEDALAAEARQGAVSLGIAGGASGSDILFHEACESMGIPTRLLLALPVDDFQAASVERGGQGWVDRYRRLVGRVPPRVLADSERLPRWLAARPGYDVWQRNNLWLMFNALAEDARALTLIALFNRERDPDGPGGTAHLVREAAARGFRTVELDARRLLS